MSRFRIAAAIAALSLAAGAARADEGFWTFDNVPFAKIKAATGVDITPAWLERVQAASARLSVGCSSSMVSGQGLLLTNAHCVSDCAHDIAPTGKDYRKDGFLAATPTEERACPGLDADVLVSIKDISARMHAAGDGLTGIALVKARDALSSVIEAEECGTDKRFHCEVVNLYHGGQFKLYRYREYSDVRLVFSPGDQAAFFGGDPDNYNFPRFDLDCAFLRLYDNGAPVATPGHLRWNPAAPKLGDPTFVSGNPGTTFREFTLAELETQRDVSAPMGMTRVSELRGRLIAFGETGPDNHRVAAEALDELENDYKVYFGRFTALSDPDFLAARRAAEADLKAKAEAKLGAGLGDPWADTAKIQAAARALYFPRLMVALNPADSMLFDYARDLVRVAAEREKPSAKRLPEYADGELPALRQQILDPRPIEPALERINLEFWFSKTREYLGVDDPAVQVMLGNDSPEDLADRLAGTSRLGDPAVRAALWDGGMKAIEASDDPMIQFALKIDPEARRIRAAYEDKVAGPTARADEAVARARFAVYGDAVYPDGTLTLRLSYGTVAGWTDRGGTVPAFTTFGGLYGRATGKPPFDLDPRWIAAKDQLNPDTVFNFVTNNDIIGGNSGSPVLNAKAEVIGAAFDGNIESLGGDYGWDGAVNRCVVVSAAAIQEALTKIYHADGLLRELAAE